MSIGDSGRMWSDRDARTGVDHELGTFVSEHIGLNERVENALVNLRPPWYPLPGYTLLFEEKEACDICEKKLFENSIVYKIVI